MPIGTGLRVKSYLALDWTRKQAVQRFKGIPAEVQAEFNKSVEKNTVRLWQLAKTTAPVQKGVEPTGTLRNAIKYIFFENPGGDKVGSVYVGRMVEPRKITKMDIKTRKAYGKLRARQVPIYIEFGTVQSRSQKFLLPALEKFYPQFQRECQAILEKWWGS